MTSSACCWPRWSSVPISSFASSRCMRPRLTESSKISCIRSRPITTLFVTSSLSALMFVRSWSSATRRAVSAPASDAAAPSSTWACALAVLGSAAGRRLFAAVLPEREAPVRRVPLERFAVEREPPDFDVAREPELFAAPVAFLALPDAFLALVDAFLAVPEAFFEAVALDLDAPDAFEPPDAFLAPPLFDADEPERLLDPDLLLDPDFGCGMPFPRSLR